MKDNNKPIGIFDSGVGGLTILSEVQKMLPNESFIYVADQKYAPYGRKTKTQVIQRAIKISSFFQDKQCKLIVIACNTATIASVKVLRKNFPVPIIGVVPVVKKAAEMTKTGNIAVFATPATIKSPYLSDLIDTYAKNVTVYKNGATGLENLIEKGIISSPKINQILTGSLLPLKEKNVDVIALGCTHYPFLKLQMKRLLGEKIQVIDSSGAVARHIKSVLLQENLLSEEKRKDMYYTTGSKSEFQRSIKKLTGEEINTTRIEL